MTTDRAPLNPTEEEREGMANALVGREGISHEAARRRVDRLIAERQAAEGEG